MSDATGWCSEVAAAAIPRMRASGSSRPSPLAIFHASAPAASVVPDATMYPTVLEALWRTAKALSCASAWSSRSRLEQSAVRSTTLASRRSRGDPNTSRVAAAV